MPNAAAECKKCGFVKKTTLIRKESIYQSIAKPLHYKAKGERAKEVDGFDDLL